MCPRAAELWLAVLDWARQVAEWEQEAAVPFLIAVKDSRTHTHTCTRTHTKGV